jgi:AcrR family transcriptional regulator
LTKSKEDLMRDFILNCCESLFTQSGYKNTSMDKIAEKCEISKPTLYNYFPSKASLFLGLVSRFQNDIAEKGKAIMGQKKDKYLVIEEFIDLSIELMQEKRDFLRMMIREHHLVVNECEDIEEHMSAEIRKRQETARELGEFMKEIVRPDILEDFSVEMIGMALSTLLEGAFWDSIKGEVNDHEKMKKLIMRLLKNGILA